MLGRAEAYEIQEKRNCLAFLKGCDRIESTYVYFGFGLAYHDPHNVPT
jgi:hypothetical protein